MCKKPAFCLFLVCIEGGIEDRLKVGGRGGRGRGSVGVSLGHGSCLSGRERGHCSLVFYTTNDPNDGDRYGTAHAFKALKRALVP